mmetsp:Transcript_5332/g.6484  ORF Transcript_5332/g.6484 Transcript_5332/m.6484 type:complete len:310 (-) Transcript_5332:32-961(-)
MISSINCLTLRNEMACNSSKSNSFLATSEQRDATLLLLDQVTADQALKVLKTFVSSVSDDSSLKDLQRTIIENHPEKNLNALQNPRSCATNLGSMESEPLSQFKAALFLIKSECKALAVNPNYYHAVSLPFTVNTWKSTFDDYTTHSKQEEHEYPRQNKQTLVYSKKFLNPVDLVPYFGTDWYFTHVGDSVGIVVGSVKLALKRHTVTEYKNQLYFENNSDIIEGSVKKQEQWFLHIGFKFTKLLRWNLNGKEGEENSDWKERARLVLQRHHPTTLRLYNKKKKQLRETRRIASKGRCKLAGKPVIRKK